MSFAIGWATLVTGWIAAGFAFFALYPHLGEQRAAAVGFLIALATVWIVAIFS